MKINGRYCRFMVSIVFSVCCMCIYAIADADAIINSSIFPDTVFRNYIAETFDKNSDGRLSEEEIKGVIRIECESKSITSLKGIEIFPNLQCLDCYDNNLTSLDVTTNSELYDLICSKNSLEVLDVSHNSKLMYLDCDHNNLKMLDVASNPRLEILICSFNQLSTIDLSYNSDLSYFEGQRNCFSSIDVSSNKKLKTLGISDNQISAIDVSNNLDLDWLSCAGNKIKSLDLSNCIDLTDLYCQDNLLIKLDLSDNPKLKVAYLNNNEIELLDIRNNPLLCDAILSGEVTEFETNVSYVKQTDTDDRHMFGFSGRMRFIIDDCELYHYISLPEKLTRIEADTFINISSEGVIIPRNVKQISGNPFAGSKVKVIWGYSGTTAESFASTYGYRFINITDRWKMLHSEYFSEDI